MTSVFDEETEYSIPVDFLQKRLWGGAGLDRLLKYARAPLALVAAFMVRTDAERYTLVVEEVPQQHPAPIQALYDALQPLVQHSSEQWYFLHETLPLVNDDA
jgi:lauroyl/myristoyl acyltransferase